MSEKLLGLNVSSQKELGDLALHFQVSAAPNLSVGSQRKGN